MPKKLFVGCLTNSITRDDLLSHFSTYGVVTDIYIPNPFRGFGFVTFADSGSTARALEVGQHVIQGTQLNVTIPQPRKELPSAPHHGGGGSGRGHDHHQGLASQAILGQLALAAAAGNPNFAGFGMDMSAFAGHAAAAAGNQAHSARSGAASGQYHW